MSLPTDVDELWRRLEMAISQETYRAQYDDEAAFEADVWRAVTKLAREFGWDVKTTCLTSHTWHAERSATAWSQFMSELAGPDVTVLGSRNRLDIVLRHPGLGSIGVELKCLGAKGHTAKLTQSIGQAMLALAQRDRAVVALHCGSVQPDERARLREVGAKMCQGTRLALVVVP